ncbi:carboxymuconolactone decarboxylase family protein [Gordonia liuliyuniae]|uniref:Carboxymuconolactone decarboxylase family protein n=1 Tax=Gordonia liuliyuniae TaxID=2911517 RepID=A0ABS9IWB7_9ACTN|nr:carboxymuconolactone decarboxylase family protein [Gordonia liuliyuniae]MCF8589863.1 carboxymuconolactone decarboxylase family protein [Gordonia liuliyuniae]
MPRLRQVSRADVTDPVISKWYDRLFGDRDPVQNPGTRTGSRGDWWTTYALVPDLFRYVAQGIEVYENPDRTIPPAIRVLCQARAGWARGSRFVFSQHSKFARAAGATDEQVDALPAWQVATCFDPAERAALTYTDCLVLGGGRVPDEIFGALVESFTDEQILELTFAIGLYEMHSTICRALRLEFDDRDDPVTEAPSATP